MRQYSRENKIIVIVFSVAMALLILLGYVLFSDAQTMSLSSKSTPIDLKSQAWDGICETCKADGKKSKVFLGECVTTLAFCGNAYYDEDGVYVPVTDCSYQTCKYVCDKGHLFYGKK